MHVKSLETLVTCNCSKFAMTMKFQKQSPRGVLRKNVFLEISQNSQKNTCARVYFLITLQSLGRPFLTEHLWATVSKICSDISAFRHCVKNVQIRSFFWTVFSCIRDKYGDLRSKSPYSVRIQENTNQKKLRIWTLFTQ